MNQEQKYSKLFDYDFQAPELLDLSVVYKKLDKIPLLRTSTVGRIKQVTGSIIQAQLVNSNIGEICYICPEGHDVVKAQIVGFNDEDVFLTPFDRLEAIGPKTKIINRGETLSIQVGNNLLGRVVDSLGMPIDDKGKLDCPIKYPVKKNSPNAMKRRRITNQLPVGVKAIDFFLPLGEGQRVGVFSTAGVGKSSLLGIIARNSTAEINVIALVGERGREVLEFLEDNLGEAGLRKSVVVVATSDDTPLRRIMAAYTATTIAEYFRDQGKKVMLLMDSVTRFARALREIALSIGESPARQGFPPSVFSTLPEIFERAGNSAKGSITALYTVLLSSEIIEDPLGEEVRAILDGHFFLSSKLAQMQHYPALDLLRSVSRVMDKIVTKEHLELAKKLVSHWSVYEENRDLISIGAYKKGSDPEIDAALELRSKLENFLRQDYHIAESFEKTLKLAKKLV
ncbi:MAG: FliI/YscN family ATPase [Deltaproteobacteria bacterium]|nr:FliI/YscN family ATPase [Deltaproteobacteria bacterium]